MKKVSIQISWEAVMAIAFIAWAVAATCGDK
jgi:hypothetical protein